MRKVLKNKPLIEAIFELRWELEDQNHGTKIDPHYRILIGSIFDRLRNEYGFHELLPTANMPDEISGYVVQHRFRVSANGWPLIQIGPGIITLNDTANYIWEDFEKRIAKIVDTLFHAYPNPSNLKPNTLLLRYIDAVDFDYKNNHIFDFLREKMNININVSPKLFEDSKVESLPLDFDIKLSFSSITPKGAVQLRFAKGKRSGLEALIWETIIHSSGESVPNSIEGINTWVKEAHELTDDWFFKIIDGELLRRFE
jgi:uncharacterized protein (TIGR04255 family)